MVFRVGFLIADVSLVTWQNPSDLDWEIDAEELDYTKGKVIGKVRHEVAQLLKTK